MRTWPASMRSWTRARLMSERAWARYWSRRRLAAAGSAVKVRMAASASSSSSSNSMSGTGGGAASSTPRVATYSGRTVRRRWPLGSMFLDGMRDQLSGLQEDKAGGEDHAQRYPLDGVEEVAQEDVEETGLTEKGEEELGSADGGEGEGEGVAGMVTVRELTEEDQGDERCRNGRVEGDGMEADGGEERARKGRVGGEGMEAEGVGGDSAAPGEGGGEAGVAAFGEVT